MIFMEFIIKIKKIHIFAQQFFVLLRIFEIIEVK